MSTKYIILLFYDIPNSTKEENVKYIKFRKYIKNIGFIYLQESIYLKNLNNKESEKVLKRDLKMIAPKDSNIRTILLTEKQFDKMYIVNGEQTFNEKVISKRIRIIEI